MAEEVVIKTVLDLSGSEQKLKQQIEKALSTPEAQTAAKNAGKKLGDALGMGIETTRRPREQKEEQHQRRLEVISSQSAARIQQIEARKQAQLDLIRERGVQKELENQRKLERAVQSASGGISGFRAALAGISGVFGALAGIGIVSFFESVGRRALDAAISLNQQVNTLKALTGSAEVAQKRLQELFVLAQKTPGLTTSLALTLDTQLRVFNVAAQTIDKLLPVIGKLNAIAPLGDPKQFVNNLTQLISQNFERQDLKELVGQSPLAGNLIKEIFNVDNPTNAEAIRASAKKLGVNTVERLAEELVKASENNPALKNVTESLGTQFDKLQDRLTVALAPLGEEIAKVLLPAFDDLVKLTVEFGREASQVFKDNRNDIIAAARAIASMTVEVGKLIISLGELAVKLQIPEFLGRAAAETRDIINDPIGQLNPFTGATNKGPELLEFERQLRAIEAERKLPRMTTGQSVLSGVLDLGKAVGDFTGTNKTRSGISGGGGRTRGGGGGVSKEAREQAREIKEMQEKILKAKDEFGQAIVNDLEEIERTITGANLSNISAGADRPRQLAGFNAANIERLRKIDLETATLERNTAEKARKELEKIEPILSNSERFMRGFAAATETTADAFERFGQNVSRAFLNIRGLFTGLKQAVLGFFNDLLGNALQNLVKNTLGGLFGNLGGLGNLFRTPSFAGGGGGISAPPSISSSFIGFGQGFGILPEAQSGQLTLDPVTAREISLGLPLGGGKFSFSGLGKGLAGAAPFLGLSTGASLGGQSIGGQILGGAGGFLTGGVIASALSPGLFSGTAAALFSNPFTAIAGAGLLIGGLLLGKAKQRKSDEEASGEFLRQALASIDQLAAGVSSGQIDGAQARSIFDSQILGTFRQQIGGLKTASVRNSRLTNQVRDLEAVYQARIPPLIADQQKRAADALAQQQRSQQNALAFSKQIPEFASGGFVPGIDHGFDSVRALLRPGEMVLTRSQQASVMSQAGPGVFDRAGVPRTSMQFGGTQAFGFGGTAQPTSFGQPLEITLEAQVVIGKNDATRIHLIGARSPQGRAITVKNVQDARTNREL